MIVVSDTSVITNLAAIGRLVLLRDLFSLIYIPDHVFFELVNKSPGVPGGQEVQQCSWIFRQRLQPSALLTYLTRQQGIHAGEAEAIVLAKEKEATWILLDDKRARKLADALGLQVLGLLGVLIRAKREGLLTAVRPELEALRDCLVR